MIKISCKTKESPETKGRERNDLFSSAFVHEGRFARNKSCLLENRIDICNDVAAPATRNAFTQLPNAAQNTIETWIS